MTPVEIAQKLIQYPSVTPLDHGAINYIAHYLTQLGFKCTLLPFTNENGTTTNNLYARKGTHGPNLCFAGHVDVVPPGDNAAWKVDPFSGDIIDNELWGRGAVDMKGALAAYLAAIQEVNTTNGSLSFLITGDEEGSGENGTQQVIAWLEEQGETIDFCLVGEPTCRTQLGDIVKIGRRGSLNGVVSVFGVQGHVAYPENAKNPIPHMLTLLNTLHTLDLATHYEAFPTSNLEITSVDVGNPTFNIIPGSITAHFNIRFNPAYSGEHLKQQITELLSRTNIEHTLEFISSSDAFLTRPHAAIDCLCNAIKRVTNTTPERTTGGGTSDARFIQHLCPVAEFGVTNTLAHKVNERVAVKDLEQLTQIYSEFMNQFFQLAEI